MTTDNRTNGPSEAQVEAAAKAIWELHARGDDPLWSGGELDYGIKQIYRKDARAALVAAAGAAPDAESDRALEIAHELAKVHTFTLAGGEAIARAALSLAAPVQPSSTVDEGKIAEVIEKANYDWSRQRLEFWRWAKNVDSPGNLNKFVARAVVEAIGGESRG